MKSNSEGGRTFADQARRKQLVQCAIELIAAEGYPRASLAKIAERADITKSVVLYHFKNKDELVAAIVESVFTEAATVIVTRVLQAETATEKLSAYIDAHREFLTRNRAGAIALWEISTSYRSSDGLRFDQQVQADVDANGVPDEFALLDPLTIIESGIAAGEFTNSLEPSAVKEALRSALDGAVTNIARLHDAFDLDSYIQTVEGIFVAALTARDLA